MCMTSLALQDEIHVSSLWPGSPHICSGVVFMLTFYVIDKFIFLHGLLASPKSLQNLHIYHILMYHVVFFCQQMDAPSSLTPSVGGGEDGLSAQKMQLMERE